MKLMTASLAFILLASLAFACTNDGKCTQEELKEGNCLDCRTSVPAKNYCIDDGLCTALEQDLGCQDCEGKDQNLNLTGFNVFAIGTGLLALGVLALLAIVTGKIVLDNKDKFTRKRRRL